MQLHLQKRNGRADMAEMLFVVGFPASVTDEELYSLFASVGQVLSARVVKGLAGESLRFGFVEMASKADAVQAKQALHRTAFKGERLIVNVGIHNDHE